MSKVGCPVRYDGDDVVSEVGYAIGKARSKKGLTLKQVASTIGTSFQFISNIEHGRTPLPAKYVSRLALALDMDVSNLVTLAMMQTHVYNTFKKV